MDIGTSLRVTSGGGTKCKIPRKTFSWWLTTSSYNISDSFGVAKTLVRVLLLQRVSEDAMKQGPFILGGHSFKRLTIVMSACHGSPSLRFRAICFKEVINSSRPA